MALFALLALLLAAGAWAQEGGEDYLYMDLYVGRDGTVLIYGETSIGDDFLELGGAVLPISDGRFSNTTDELTSKDGSSWNLTLQIGHDFAWGEIDVYLPSGAAIIGSPEPSVFARTEEEKGSLVVRFPWWTPEAPVSELHVSYELGPPSFSLDLQDYLLPIFLLGVGLVVVALFIRYALPSLRPREVQDLGSVDGGKLEAIAPTLTERERAVLNSVISEGGRVSQRKLRHLCDMPKSSLSRVTDELQRKGLIRKIPVGQTNEIRLDERLLARGKEGDQGN
jgi:hypothetical protein